MSQPRFVKRLGLAVIDAVALQFALWSAFALRFGTFWPSHLDEAHISFAFVATAGVLIFAKLGLYRAVLRHVRITAARSVILGVTLLSLSTYVFGETLLDRRIPISVVVIFALASMLYVSGTRLLVRYYYRWVVDRYIDRERVLIFGAGGAGAQLARLLESGAEYLPVGFADDDPSLWGSDVFGLRVYNPKELHDVILELRVTSILIALPNETSKIRAEVAESLAKYHVSVKTIPSMPEIISGASLDRLREVQLEDLLGRVAVEPMSNLFNTSLAGKNVCITGAGGSIGAELSRQTLLGGANKVVLVEHSEYALYQIERELVDLIKQKGLIGKVQLKAFLLSVSDEDRLKYILGEERVNTVYHAAAYKHVPIVESNPFQGVMNNAFGTLSAAMAASLAGVERFVLISTDKAVRPTNVMGASKRLAELILQTLASKPETTTIFSIVRFGNVLGSSGSVVPLFKSQIEAGGPVTVTHPQINRYFMTISEATSLVIQAGAMAHGGEVFVLDMGEPIKISDLAERMIRLSGFEIKSDKNPQGNIEIVYTGLRPGEKLYEELLIGGDISGTGHPKILRAEEQRLSEQELDDALKLTRKAIDSGDKGLLTATLLKYINGYKPHNGSFFRDQEQVSKSNKVIPIRANSIE